jgi:hypothetical protein
LHVSPLVPNGEHRPAQHGHEYEDDEGHPSEPFRIGGQIDDPQNEARGR